MNQTADKLTLRDLDPFLTLSREAQNKKRPPDLDVVLNALGNHHRRLLFGILCHKEAQIQDLGIITNGDYQAIRKQLKILEDNGLIASYKDGKDRYYHANSNSLDSLNLWTNSMQRVLLASN